jgi:propionyl-CoA carboxylase alpha chain
MELHVYAEDPLNDFLPSIGHLDVYQDLKVHTRW